MTSNGMGESARAEAGLVWFRRDLRCDDHAALHHALADCRRVWCVFVLDTTIIEPLLQCKRDAHPDEMPTDRRIDFILASLSELDSALRKMGGGLLVFHNDPRESIPELAEALGVDAVYANRDYEPVPIERDAVIEARLREAGRAFYSFKDQVVFERDEILTRSGKPYVVFTPYRNAWLKKLTPDDLARYRIAPASGQLCAPPAGIACDVPDLATLGFAPSNLDQLELPAGMSGAHAMFDDFLGRMGDYAVQRNFPAMNGPSHLSVHLRFGTISVRALARAAHGRSLERGGEGAAAWLNELIWRDFFFMVLEHHPWLAQGRAFRAQYDAIRWETGTKADTWFAAWCEGRTGYPFIDAGMRQLAQTGYMHNRLRMVTASFLVKNLGIDWRRGERFFAEHLNDFDFAANNGGWQWVASTGCDAQPWFRVFNPVTQSRQYDPHGRFIKRYVPELDLLSARAIHAPWLTPAALAEAGLMLGRDYPHPIIDDTEARARSLERFKAVKGGGRSHV
jgi:deoxyribodipyrimidine photo-lyase